MTRTLLLLALLSACTACGGAAPQTLTIPPPSTPGPPPSPTAPPSPPQAPRDTDMDGLIDVDDACPEEPEDRDQFEDDDGCPDLDNDQDGVPNAEDTCLNQPGAAADQGCPRVVIPTILHPPRSNERIFFDLLSAKPVKHATPILEEVAQVMRDNPRITLLELRGHADVPGGEVRNLKLSERRALEVQRVLVELGVEPERLEVRAMGNAQPLVRLEGLRGEALRKERLKNQRVEFHIIRTAP